MIGRRSFVAVGILGSLFASTESRISVRADLLHRFTFNDGTADDSVSGLNGTPVDPAGILSFSHGQVDLTANNGANSSQDFLGDPDAVGAYIDLPNGIFTGAVNSGAAGQVTIEAWLTIEENRNWARIFDFGTKDEGEDAWTGLAQNSDFVTVWAQSFRQALGANTHTTPHVEIFIEDEQPLSPGVEHYIVYSLDAQDTADGAHPNGTQSLYLDNELIGSAEIVGGLDVATMDDVNNWIGRSQWDNPLLDGYVNELSIHDAVLNQQQIDANFFFGPTPVTYTWIADGSGGWSDSNNWSRGEVPLGSETHVFFGDTAAAPTAVTIDENASVESMEIFSNQPYTFIAEADHTLELSGFAELFVATGIHAIDAKIVGEAGLTKFGQGTLVLSGDNEYFGFTNVYEGELLIDSPGSLGNSLDTWISGFDGRITLGDLDILDQYLILEGRHGLEPHVVNQGSNFLPNDIELNVLDGANHTLQVDSGFLEVGGRVTNVGAPAMLHFNVAGGANGALTGYFEEQFGNIGLLKSGLGELTIYTEFLSPGDLHTGPTNVQQGVLRVEAGDFSQELLSNVITVGALGTFDVNSFFNYQLAPSQTLTGDGVVNAFQLTASPTSAIRGNLIVSGDVINQGLVAPGFSPGIIEIQGEYIQETTGVLEIEVGGLIPGEQHDQVIVSGLAVLGGRLEAPIIDGFVPAADDQVTFLTAEAGVSGQFNSIFAPNLAAADPNLAVEVIVEGTEARLRFAATSFDTQFVSQEQGADWNEGIWSGPTPTSLNAIQLTSQTGGAQTVRVASSDAQTHQLSVGANVTVGVQNGFQLSATTDVTVAAQGKIELDNGSLVSSRVSVDAGGVLSGNGSIVGDLEVGVLAGQGAAVLSPGFSVGSISVEGSYRQTDTGQLVIEIEGIDQGQFDTLEVAGNVEFGGELRIVVPEAGLIEPGQTFEVLTAGSFTDGAIFDNVVTEGDEDIFFAPIYSNAFPPGVAALVGDGFGVGSYPEGDMNRDTVVNLDDAATFALAITQPRVYRNSFFISGSVSGDIDDDGDIDFDDIDDFSSLVPGMTVVHVMEAIRRASQVPEPGTIGMILIVAVVGACRHRLSWAQSKRPA